MLCFFFIYSASAVSPEWQVKVSVRHLHFNVLVFFFHLWCWMQNASLHCFLRWFGVVIVLSAWFASFLHFALVKRTLDHFTGHAIGQTECAACRSTMLSLLRLNMNSNGLSVYTVVGIGACRSQLFWLITFFMFKYTGSRNTSFLSTLTFHITTDTCNWQLHNIVWVLSELTDVWWNIC